MMKPILLALALVVSTPALAQPKAKDAEGFEPVASDMMQKGESIPASRLVATAYGFIWAAVLFWVGSVAMRARRLEDEVDELKRKLERKQS